MVHAARHYQRQHVHDLGMFACSTMHERRYQPSSLCHALLAKALAPCRYSAAWDEDDWAAVHSFGYAYLLELPFPPGTPPDPLGAPRVVCRAPTTLGISAWLWTTTWRQPRYSSGSIFGTYITHVRDPSQAHSGIVTYYCSEHRSLVSSLAVLLASCWQLKSLGRCSGHLIVT